MRMPAPEAPTEPKRENAREADGLSRRALIAGSAALTLAPLAAAAQAPGRKPAPAAKPAEAPASRPRPSR